MQFKKVTRKLNSAKLDYVVPAPGTADRRNFAISLTRLGLLCLDLLFDFPFNPLWFDFLLSSLLAIGPELLQIAEIK